MTHIWIGTKDGDLLRADQIRQINVVEGLRVVTTSGSQFLVAEIEGREATIAVARDLVRAIAQADGWSHAAEIDVVREGAAWTVRLTRISGTAAQTDIDTGTGIDTGRSASGSAA
jgi:hypothetical protein